MGFVVTESK